ncbi:MAG: hypothetical protein ACJ75H_00180 [Thermoanaerobaculia bacterium]
MMNQQPVSRLSLCDAIAFEADPAPAELGGAYAKIHASAFSDAGDVAFSVSLKGSKTDGAVLLRTADGPRVIVRSGDRSPEGGRFAAFGELDATFIRAGRLESSIVLFRATLEGCAAAEGLFLWTPDELKPVALAGGTSPRGKTYQSFSQITIDSLRGDSPKLAFVAAMEDGSESIILQPLFGDATPNEVLATGDLLKENVVDGFVISRMGLSLSCVAGLRHPQLKRKRTREVIALDRGFILHDSPLKEKTKMPSFGRLKHIVGRPAVNFQDGFVALEFEDGATALAQRMMDGDACIFARSGGPAPGFSGPFVESFGPPVANSLSPNVPGFAPCFWIASAVRLPRGKKALWLGRYTNKAPLLGEAVLVRPEEIRFENGPERSFRSFSPVKLNNHGDLLLRGSVQGEDGAREGIFVWKN